MHGHDVGRAAVCAGSLMALASLALTVDNARHIRVPDPAAVPDVESLAVLVPMRDEIDNVAPCLSAIVAAADRWPGPVAIVVLDDESADGTRAALEAVAASEPRIEILDGAPTPGGWLGKPWACAQLALHVLAGAERPGVLVFVDADVRVQPHALAATVALMRQLDLSLVSPFPRQIVRGPAERLVQPLLQWSWMSTLPLRAAERSSRGSLSAANGQLLAIDSGAYLRAGGHEAVRGEVLEDIALLRAVKAAGGFGSVADGSTVASCRMYQGWSEVHAGYRKSLWSAFGSPTGAAAVMSMLTLAYVVPPLAALTGSRVGLLGYAAGVASRAVSARRTGGRVWPDSLAHPASVVTLAALTADSVIARRRGALRWKGRAVAVHR
ncbi:glycosyltransferase [Gordonia sp. NPDC003425]